MHRRLIILPALLTFPLAGCVVGMASGEPYSESLTYANFDRIDVSAGVEVIATQGAFDVKAEVTEGEGFDNLIVEVKGETLRIGRKMSMFNWDGPSYRVNVSAPSYTGLEASSGSRLEGRNLNVQDLDVEVSSGASVELAGACAQLDLDISSGASFDGEGLRCANARVDASSGANVDAFATQLADGEASSGANVTFHGQPQQVREDTSSGGSVQAR